MSETTKELVDEFISYLIREFRSEKHLRHVQFEKYTLNDNKIDFRFFYKDFQGHVYADLRELKENRDDFSHIKNNIIDQLSKAITIEH